MLTEQFIHAILDDWPDWLEAGMHLDVQPALIKIFDDGLSHDVALLSTHYGGVEGRHVLKCFNKTHPSAIQAQQWASELGLAPTISYTDPDFTYCLMPYLRSPAITPESTSSTDRCAIANALNITHSAPIPDIASSSRVFDLLKFCEHYLESAGDQAQIIHQQMVEPINDFINDTTPMSFCHNDLVPGNCFVINGQAQFIDWEYAQPHNPWFDLAAIIYYLQLNDKQAAVFLDDYQAGWSVFVGTSIFYSSQLALLWGDMLWHLAKFGLEFWPRLNLKLNDLEQLLKIHCSLGTSDLI